jgi:hypothetical protein
MASPPKPLLPSVQEQYGQKPKGKKKECERAWSHRAGVHCKYCGTTPEKDA